MQESSKRDSKPMPRIVNTNPSNGLNPTKNMKPVLSWTQRIIIIQPHQKQKKIVFNFTLNYITFYVFKLFLLYF